MPRRYLTLGDLKELLRSNELTGIPDETPVHFTYDYGDHCHTMVAPPVKSIELALLEDISYPIYGKKLFTGEVDENDDTLITAIVIS